MAFTSSMVVIPLSARNVTMDLFQSMPMVYTMDKGALASMPWYGCMRQSVKASTRYITMVSVDVGEEQQTHKNR
jgi:hypothetical protein